MPNPLVGLGAYAAPAGTNGSSGSASVFETFDDPAEFGVNVTAPQVAFLVLGAASFIALLKWWGFRVMIAGGR